MTRPQYSSRALILFVISIIILGFAVYSNSLNGKFVWDDEILIKGNTYIQDWSKLSKLFTEDIGAGSAHKYNFYRPLQMLTYMVDYSIWGLNVVGYHLTNIILHILVALCICWLVNILFNDKFLSFVTAILFVAHPIHTEAVTYLSGRTDPLATFFILLCFILYIKGLELKSAKVYIFMVLSYLAALLSRESSLILPLLILLYHYAFKKKLVLRKYLPLLAIAFIYIILRLTILKFLLSIVPHPTISQRILGFFVAIASYCKLLFLPFNLHFVYEYKPFNLTNPVTILGAAILFLLSIYAFRKRKTNKLIFFSVYWFFIALLPVANIYPINAHMAEHWLYMPSIGFFIILAKVLSSGYSYKKFRTISIVFTILLLAFYSILTIRQNNYWREPIAFYKRALQHAPHSLRAYNNLGVAYVNIGKNEEAIASFKKALEINPDDAKIYYNLGNTYKIIGKYEEAIAFYNSAIAITPNDITVYNNLGNAYVDIGKYEEAIGAYKRALKINPAYGSAHANLALAYYDVKQYDLAVKHCDRAVELGAKVNPEFLKLLKGGKR